MTSRTMAVGMAAGGLFGVAAIVGGDELPTQAPQRLPAPVVDAHELMEVFSEPLYEHLKQDMASQPADAKAWGHIKDHGIEAAEIANLTAIRKVEPAKQRDWDRLARGAQQAGIDLAHAAAAKDWAKTQAAYKGVIKNCNECHEAHGGDHAPELEP
jgi:hypothetical protein